MANYTIKAYSTYPPLSITLTDTNGPINITTASALAFVAKGTQTMTLITGALTPITPASGIVSYPWGATDTDVPDNYPFEVQITWPGGPPTQIQIVPSAAASNQTLEIDADLDTSMGIVAECLECRDAGKEQKAVWIPGKGEPGTEEREPGYWNCLSPTAGHGKDCHVQVMEMPAHA